MTDEFEDLKKYIGVSETDEDVVVASTIAKLAATIGVDNPAPNQGDPLPPGWHTPFFGAATPPGELRENVTTPGGTTAAAMKVLMAQDGLGALMTQAVTAAARRSRELAGR